MKIKLILIGKTSQEFVREGIEIFEQRVRRYCDFTIQVVRDSKNLKSVPIEKVKQDEGNLILKQIQDTEEVILLDENGKEMNSVEFSGMLDAYSLSSTKSLVFIVGGAYGFSQEVYARANRKLALSRMTFSHQLVRVIFMEQLYRAFTILKGEPYHHS